MSISAITKHGFKLIPVADIQETVVQLRTHYANEPLQELGNSLEDDGLLQPIVVAPGDEFKFELIIGSRRLRAARHKGMEEIPALVIEETSPLNYLLIALGENLHREDLNPFEEAHAFLRLMKDYGLGVQEVAVRTHKGEAFVRKRMELLSMPENVQAMIAEKKLALHFVQALARLPTGEQQVYYAQKALSEGLSISELRQLITSDAGEMAPRTKRDFSADKVRVRIDMFARWMKRLSANSAFNRSLNAEERAALARSVQSLDGELRVARSVFGEWVGRTPVRSIPNLSNIVDDPDNHGDQWSLRHIEMITANDRPSDDMLATKLGRSVAAIRGMRSKMQRERKDRKTG
ncbi:MAG: ParB/RepB/Spo0J family partition protein [Candidatus Paceibacterota bacterium]